VTRAIVCVVLMVVAIGAAWADWTCVHSGGIWPECYEVRAGHYTRLEGRL
jgi:hypothetical protein